ncbi:hypothetical protein VT84_04040 [Gemmata sp. SH-PL17]|uniref:hypothetical protein n=1 Tax=Gemmata sp. SH-PL17 TaxID=1630693 RepID=UPI0004B77D15|nr:hypothetical protein [Gemmata sp. SH-PL17]AMV23556.1 hypothetical protein VT84_04040 [Gemmata sp. SH-PL17]
MAAWDEFDRPSYERPVEGLKRIARYHRWLIAVVLAQLALWAGFIALTVLARGREPDMQFPFVLTLILGGVGGIFVFLLSWELRGAFAALVFGFATVVPCMGLLVLTLVSGYATAELRKHGVKVGILGASLADIDERPSLYDDEDAGW